MSRMQNATTVCAILLLLFFQRGVERWAAARETVWIPPGDSERDKWNPRLVAFASLGHVLAVADWLWLRFLLDQNLAHVPQGVHAGVFADLDLATDLDPAFFEAYVSGASALAVVRNDADGAIKLLEKAERFATAELSAHSPQFQAKVWRDRWLVPLLLAYTHLFEKEDLPSAARAFIRASELEGSPFYLRSLSERLKKIDGIYDVAERLLRFLSLRAADPAQKSGYERKIFSIEVDRFVFNLDREFKAFRNGRPVGESAAESWRVFRADYGIDEHDRWGGRLFLDDSSRVESTTDRERVLGIRH